MAIKHIEPMREVSGGIDADYARDSSRAHLIWSDVADDENYIIGHCGISIGSAHPTDLYQRCLAVRATLIDRTTYPIDNSDAFLWKLEVSYGHWNIMERSPDGNPLNIPTRFRLDFNSQLVPCLVDVEGNPIVNSAGDYYDPPVEVERVNATLTVMRNESGANLANVASYGNTINLNPWNGFPAKTVRMLPIKMPAVAYSQAVNTLYYPMEYVFEINFDTWTKQVLNQGYRQLDDAGNLVPILVNGQPVDVPIMLDEDGHAILAPAAEDIFGGGNEPGAADPGGWDGEVPGGGQPPRGGLGTAPGSAVVINAFDVYRTADFSMSGGLDMDNLFTLPGVF